VSWGADSLSPSGGTHVGAGHTQPTAAFGVETGTMKYIRYAFNGEEELYDVATDPFETTNLAADPSFRGGQGGAVPAVGSVVGPASRRYDDRHRPVGAAPHA